MNKLILLFLFFVCVIHAEEVMKKDEILKMLKEVVESTKESKSASDKEDQEPLSKLEIENTQKIQKLKRLLWNMEQKIGEINILIPLKQCSIIALGNQRSCLLKQNYLDEIIFKNKEKIALKKEIDSKKQKIRLISLNDSRAILSLENELLRGTNKRNSSSRSRSYRNNGNEETIELTHGLIYNDYKIIFTNKYVKLNHRGL